MMNQRSRSRVGKSQQGFTIVELMIATSVLAVLLVLVALVMTGVGRLYIKGVNQARIQNATRSIVDQIGAEIQLSDATGVKRPDPQPAPSTPSNPGQDVIYPPNFTISAFCLKNTRYTYILNKQIGSESNQIPHVLWRDKAPTDVCTPVNLASTTLSGGTELMPPNSRLTAFSITQNSPYRIAIGIAYGDDDLLNIQPGTYTNGPYPIDLSGLKTTCKDTKGNQFCATANLQTTITKRLWGGK